MEETKEVKQEFTKEQLEGICHQLSEQNLSLRKELEQANMFNLIKRMDFLLNIIKVSDKFPKEFVDKCTSEVIELITIPEETKKEESK